MKAIILAVLVGSVSFAATIDFDSSTSTANNSGGATVLATVNPGWATALAASEWITAAGDQDPALGTTMTFTVDLDLAGTFNPVTLDLGVFADDSATLMLDGTTLFNEDTTLGTLCAAGVIGCTGGTEGVLTNLDVTADVHSGMNTLTLEVFQEQAGSFGTDFAGAMIPSEVATTPEPTAVFFLAAALVGIGLVSRRVALGNLFRRAVG